MLWITQSVPDCHRSRTRFEQLGLRTLALPVLQVEPVAVQFPAIVPDAIVFTSGHGVRHHGFAPGWNKVPVFAVGHQTAVAAMFAGYSDVRSAGGDVADLQKVIATTLPRPARVVIFGAREFAGHLEDYLRRCSYEVERCVVYETRCASDAELRRAIDRLATMDGICVYSPKGAKRIAEIIRRSGWTGALFCLSQACADVFEDRHGLHIGVARRPDIDGLIDLVRASWGLGQGHREPGTSRSQSLWHLQSRRAPRRSTAIANDNVVEILKQVAKTDEGGEEPPPSAA